MIQLNHALKCESYIAETLNGNNDFVYNYYDKHTLSVEHDIHNNVIQTYNMTNFYKCMVVWYI